MNQYSFKEPGTVYDQLKALGITLQPCPPWCADDHFGPHPMALHAQDGFFHNGPETTITDDSAGLGDGSHDAELRLGLASWVPTLAAAPGPAHVCVSDGGDGVYYFAPETARELASELNRLADQADKG
jgi:hypothetical protein